MATCQQAGGGNVIPRRKAGVISLCMLVWEGIRLDETLHISNTLSLLLFFFCLPICLLSLCLFSPCTLISPGSVFTAEFRIALQCLRWLLCSKAHKGMVQSISFFFFFTASLTVARFSTICICHICMYFFFTDYWFCHSFLFGLLIHYSYGLVLKRVTWSVICQV